MFLQYIHLQCLDIFYKCKKNIWLTETIFLDLICFLIELTDLLIKPVKWRPTFREITPLLAFWLFRLMLLKLLLLLLDYIKEHQPPFLLISSGDNLCNGLKMLRVFSELRSLTFPSESSWKSDRSRLWSGKDACSLDRLGSKAKAHDNFHLDDNPGKHIWTLCGDFKARPWRDGAESVFLHNNSNKVSNILLNKAFSAPSIHLRTFEDFTSSI